MQPEKKFYDGVFDADKRNTNQAIQSLAQWLTIEQLQKLDAKE